MKKLHPHPGKYLRQLIRGFEITTDQLASRLNTHPAHVCQMLTGHRPINFTMACRLGQVFPDFSAEWWAHSQAMFELDQCREYLPFQDAEPFRRPRKDSMPTVFDRCICMHWGWEHTDMKGPCMSVRCRCPNYEKLGNVVKAISKEMGIEIDE